MTLAKTCRASNMMQDFKKANMQPWKLAESLCCSIVALKKIEYHHETLK